MLLKNLTAILFFLTSFLFVGGQDIHLRVLDKESGAPVTEASIVLESIASGRQTSGGITDSQGQLTMKMDERSVVHISCIGYSTLSAELSPGFEGVFYLEADPFQLEQVVVTATRTEKALKDVPVLTNLISSRHIESGGYDNITGILETELPGLEFQRHGTSMDVEMQGLGGRNILFLVDGERLAGETRGNVDYHRLNSMDIGRIEVVRGASSALYGSQAMGAVVNIISKERREKVFADLSMKYSSFHMRDFTEQEKKAENGAFYRKLDLPNLNLDATAGFNWKGLRSKTNLSFRSLDAYRLYNRDSVVKEFQSPDTTVYEELDTDPVEIEGHASMSIAQNLRYTISKALYLEAYGGYYKRHKYDYYQIDKMHAYFDDWNYGFRAGWSPGETGSLQFSLHSDTYNKYEYREALGLADLDYRNSYVNPKVVGNFRLGKKQELVAGLEYLYESLLTDMFVYGELISKRASSTVAFFQDELSLGSHVTISAGMRLGRHTAFGPYLTPKVSAMFKWAPLTFRLNYAAGYRSPSLKELYMNWNHLDMFMIMGNRELQPESNNYYSFSVEFTRGRLNASLNSYMNLFRDKIEGRWEDDQTIYRYTNVSESSLSGADFQFRFRLANPLFLKAAYAYVNDANRKDGVRLSSVSPHSANMQLEYRFRRPNYQLNAKLSCRYIGAKDFLTSNNLEIDGEEVEAWYPVHYDAYSVWRLALDHRIRRGINLVLGVENLFGYSAPIVTFNSSISPGRSWFLQLRLGLNHLWNSTH